ncbi:hypothetical protein HDIA_3347 [Hartmannibacter diazotrophicus]|uniref:Uncharacterized protein n=1 Tax=Hartmannibacter diazotrophicus TaxID=1482074 RepID=A0A2C9D9S2_9HYPH|nr:hypothetical protein HDIA_3347 [Hartmannibacter diazotrophicus]
MLAVLSGVLAAARPAAADNPPPLDVGRPTTVQTEAVADLWSKVKASCIRETTPRLIVDNAGLSRNNPYVSDPLRNLMQAKLDAAFDSLFQSEQTGWRREIPPADLTTLRAYVNGEAFGPNPTVDFYRDSYLFTSANVTATPAGQFLLTLKAQGLGGCAAQSTAFVLPEDQIGDPVESLDSIFARAASEMVRQAKNGKTTVVYLSAEVEGEGEAPARWTESFIDQTRLAVNDARGKMSTKVIGSEQVIKVEPVSAEPSSDGEAWNSNIKVERKRNTYRVLVSILLPGQSQDIVERGLISPDSLPPIPVEQLSDATFTGATGKLLILTEEQRSVVGDFANATDVQDYSFRKQAPGVVEFTAAATDGGPDPVVAVYDADGQILDEIPSRAPITHRFRIGSGIYRLRISNTNRSSAQYQLISREAEESFRPLLPPGAEVKREFRDWQTGEIFQDGRRACFAITPAERWAPSNWRPIQPYIWFLVPEDAGDDPLLIEQKFDAAVYYDPQSPISGAVFGSGGSWGIPLSVMNNQVQSLGRGDAMSIESLEGLTQGNLLAIDGMTRDGQVAHVEYSLRGYQAAINEMLSDCGRREMRQLLIRR